MNGHHGDLDECRPAVSLMGIRASGFDFFYSVNVFWIRRVHRRLHDEAFGCTADEVERVTSH